MKNKINILGQIPLLQLLGIDEDSALTLLTIIQKSPISITDIAIHRTVSRTTIYKHIAHLEEKGLISHHKTSKKVVVTDKAYIVSKIEHAFEESHSQLKEDLRGSLKETPVIEVRTDSEAIADIYVDIGITLPRGGTYFRYTSRKEDGKRSPQYIDLKKRKEIERLVITSAEKASQKTKDPNRFIKTIPESFSFDDNVSLIIYDNKVAHIDHTTGATITITSKNIARFQEKIFKLLWKRL